MAGSGFSKRNLRRLFLFGGGVFAFSTLSHSALAHIRLTQPTSRHPIPASEDGSFLKDGPCGGGDDARTSDPSRISRFAPGETITVEWHETVHHDSHYRIAFDDSGQDAFADPEDESDIVDPPALPILLDGIPDKSPTKDSYSVQVTLPSTPCEACTLQLIQYMYGRNQPMYYQCADIVISAEPSTLGPGEGGQSSGAFEPTPDEGAGGSEFQEEGAADATGGVAASNDSQGVSNESEKGCSWVSGHQEKTPPWGAAFVTMLAGFSLLRRRRLLRPRQE